MMVEQKDGIYEMLTALGTDSSPYITIDLITVAAGQKDIEGDVLALGCSYSTPGQYVHGVA